MTERFDWERWQEEWQHGTSAHADVATALRQIAAARRGLFFVELLESGIAAGSIILVSLALRHAANPFEAGLGLSVGIAIGLIWSQRILMRRSEHLSVTENSDRHLTAVRTLRLKQARLARFIWIVIGLDLAFLIPWWVIGTRVHGRQLESFGSWLTVWLPIAVFIALFIWSVRLRSGALREVGEIDRVRQEYREDEEAGNNIS